MAEMTPDDLALITEMVRQAIERIQAENKGEADDKKDA